MKIAELHDGRELSFPDSMSDAQVDRIVKAMMESEAECARMKTEMQIMQARVDALMAAMAKPAAAHTPVDLLPVVEELQAMRNDLNRGLKQVVKAQLADTILVRDEIGEQTRSRKVLSVSMPSI